MTVNILGGAWISATGYGTLRSQDHPHFPAAEPLLPDPAGILPRLPSRYGRFDHFSKTGLLCAALALADAGASPEEVFRPWGIVLASTLESTATDLAYWNTTLEEDGAFTSPNLFSYTLPGTVAGEISILWRMTGPVLALAQPAEAFGKPAVETAGLLLESGTVPAVLCGWNDVPLPDPRHAGLTPCGACFLLLSASEDPGEGMAARAGVRFAFDSRESRSLTELFREARG